MPLNFAGPGGELVTPEGFMGAQVDRSYLLYAVESPCRDTLKSMDNPLLPSPEKPRRLRPDVERFFVDFIRRQDSMARMFWEYICRNDARMDQFEEALRRRP